MIRGTTRVAGVFGYPVKHSASPAMHNAAFAALGLDYVYVPFEVVPERIGAALAGVRALGMVGVNVTVPLKELVAPHLDDVTEQARILGSVNTIINRDGKLTGDSTDGPGFLAGLAHDGFSVGRETRAVVLGAGGSARAVIYSLIKAGAFVTIANRNRERAEALARTLGQERATAIPLNEKSIGDAVQQGADLLVNTTSVGMHPGDSEMPPVPPDVLTESLFVSDLIYNPFETRLLAAAKGRGCRSQNGIEMLVRQGAIAFTHWTGLEPPVDVMRQAVYEVVGSRQ